MAKKADETPAQGKPEKLDTKHYNTTDLDPKTAFERHVYHRDQFAHFLRWSHILREMKIGDTVTDFGCGNGNLLEVLYRNRFKAALYTGIDIRKKTVEAAAEKFSSVEWAKFVVGDLVKMSPARVKEIAPPAKHVCSFEVMEHVGKQNADKFLKNFAACGDENSVFYLSTPNYDEKVGAAGNHTYDSGDGKGVQPQEFTHAELTKALSKHFEIVKKYGTFASQKDYKKLLTPAQKEVFDAIGEYYDSNLVSVIFAPLFPEQSRNTMWILKKK